MTKINLANGYFIEIDSMCHTLKRTYTGKKKGEAQEKESVCGYYGTLGQAIEKIIFLNKIDKLGDKAAELREYVEMAEKADKAAVRAVNKAIQALTEGKNE